MLKELAQSFFEHSEISLPILLKKNVPLAKAVAKSKKKNKKSRGAALFFGLIKTKF